MTGDDRARLLGSLTAARNHVLDQIGSLAPDDLVRSRVPSGWTPLGLVRHLTLSDERFWFEVVVAGGELDFWPEDENGDWLVEPGTDPEQVIEAYRRSIANSDEIIADLSLDDALRGPAPEWAPPDAFSTVRAVVVHVLVETATHAGQLDIARELADGSQYIVL